MDPAGLKAPSDPPDPRGLVAKSDRAGPSDRRVKLGQLDRPDPVAFRAICSIFCSRYKDKKIDKIVGIDARGFLFGSVLAYELGKGFIPIRKKGKLPYQTIREAYTLEYGEEIVEIHADAIESGERVVIVDDLMATGGTIAAAANLVEKLGGDIFECSFVLELPDLNGREKLGNRNVFSIVEFDGE